MYVLYEEENNSQAIQNKINEYISEYIKNYYTQKEENGVVIPRTTTEVELTLVKSATSGAWLIKDDTDIYNLCNYNNGQYEINLIKTEFQKYRDARREEERKQKMAQ